VNIQAKYRTRGSIGMSDISKVAMQFRASGFDGGFLIVTNAPLSDEARLHNAELSAEIGKVEVVTWNDERDDDVLARALVRNAR
jgi:hypothetical protein